MLVHSLALLVIYAKHFAPTRVLTITLDSLPALRPSRAGSKSTAHWPLRASFQVSLNPAQQAGRLCLRPSATPLLRTEEGAQPLACLFLLRVGFIILQSAAPAQQAGRLCQCLRPSATPLLRTEEGAQQLACLFLLRVGFHHPAFSSNPSSPSNRVCAQASWAITTSRPRHHSPVPEVGPSFDHYWSKCHVTERT